MPEQHESLDPASSKELPRQVECNCCRHSEDSEDGRLQNILSINISISFEEDCDEAHQNLQSVKREYDVVSVPYLVCLVQHYQHEGLAQDSHQ